MKTIKQWLEELPEPYKTQADKNIDKRMESLKIDSLSKALGYAFVFEDSPQGRDYWYNLYCKIRNSEIY